MTIVLDTNIVVSGVFFRSGNEAKLLDLFTQNRYKLAVTPPILEEYKRVLNRDKFKNYRQYDQHFIAELIEEIRLSGKFYPGTTPVDPIEADRSDEKFLACAVEAEANAIVTGDGNHLLNLGAYKNCPIIRAATCLELIKKEQATQTETADYQQLLQLAQKRGLSTEQLLEEIKQRTKAHE